jgi:hypothetical protein
MLSRTSRYSGLGVVEPPLTSSPAQLDRRANVGVGEISRRLLTRALEGAVSLFQRSARRLRSGLALFSGLELGTERQIEEERIALEEAYFGRPPRFAASMPSARVEQPLTCESKFQIRSIEGDRWTVMDDHDRIVCIGSKQACEDWLDYQENASRAAN